VLIVVGYFNFGRCIKKSGQFVNPHQIAQKVSDEIEVQVSLKEKYKLGGYRSISLKIYDTKGGDFVENPDLSIVVIEQKGHTVIAEIPKDLPLLTGPDGLYKKIEIGVNNYDPSIFLS
jgi:hypothetical protein